MLHAQSPAPADEALIRAHALSAAGDRAAARNEYARLAANTNASPALRTLAQLSLARSWRLEKDYAAAQREYTAVDTLPGAPKHLRQEAREQLAQLARLQAGLPPRDPASSRTPWSPPERPGAEWHLSPNGSDANPGTAALPFATLERARDEIRRSRTAQGLPPGGCRVLVHGGLYPRQRTLTLTAEDSGAADRLVVYQAVPGENPVFSGGVRVRQFTPVQDPGLLRRLPENARGKVYQADLRAQGITNVPPVRLGGFASGAGFRSHPALELFCNGEAMPLAHWPNDGFVRVGEVRTPSPPTAAKPATFTFLEDRPARWTEDPDVVLYGYWFYGWADSYERVAKIDVPTKTITLAPPFHSYGYRGGQPYKALNLFSEIDQPGEWYLDRQQLTLFFYPPGDPATTEVELSLLPSPLLELKQVAHVVFQGLTWELGATDVVRASGGEHCLLLGCTIRRSAGNAVEFAGGSHHGLLSCDLHSLGRSGVVLTGGDRRTLTPGHHFVENCHIFDLSRLDRTYTPAVLLNGVGHRVAHNLLHHIPSSALRVEGNDHRVEFNEIARVVLESDDQGGVDMFGNPTFRGNEYRGNYFHHIGHWREPGKEPDCGQAGIRLDDMISGTLIIENIFRHCAAGRLGFGGVQIHGGKDNCVDHNLFLDCASAVSFSPWGPQAWRERSAGSLDPNTLDLPLFTTRYPDLTRLNEDLNVNYLWRNLVVHCGEFLRRNSGGARLLGNCVVTNPTPLLLNPEGGVSFDRAQALLDRAGVDPLPTAEIGLYVDPFRDRLPAPPLAQLRADQ
jgi:hypothetical protein